MCLAHSSMISFYSGVNPNEGDGYDDTNDNDRY